MVLKFCANLSFMFGESTSLLEKYELARKAGFTGVECANPYNYSTSELLQAKCAMKQVLINVAPGNDESGKFGLAAIPGKTFEFLETLKKTINYAKDLNCSKIHIMSGVVEKETPQHMEIYVNNLKQSVEMLKENNIIGLIEPINNYSVPNYFLNNYEKATSVIEKINSPNIKLQLDIFHLQHICGNLTKNIEKFLPLVGHVQVAQVPNRNEPDTSGEIDYKYIFSTLEKLQYDQWIGLEYFPKSSTVDGLKWIKEFGYTL
ncbi:transient receptor potential locus C protein precursor, putative [Pediculus humanus corporis]|uniref:Putative hydroxypyruvate isomerase n=1 Tax=Pediculus humanus subsp. corporis TaxID=121224 RepID=E0VPP2_PEDHC|nr:transient receptor potential locus C protein precursor, putative [Pediculus humanus corporis]EEB15348.1 transient receptor potential locus C protein precursor, putative [Pediculus humanus corporis]